MPHNYFRFFPTTLQHMCWSQMDHRSNIWTHSASSQKDAHTNTRTHDWWWVSLTSQYLCSFRLIFFFTHLCFVYETKKNLQHMARRAMLSCYFSFFSTSWQKKYVFNLKNIPDTILTLKISICIYFGIDALKSW